MKLIAIALAGGMLLAQGAIQGSARAQDVETLLVSQDWTAYRYLEDGKPVCYIASKPTKEEGDYTRRGEVFAEVVHWPGDGGQGVVTFIAGYPIKEDSQVKLEIDSEQFLLYVRPPQMERAYAPNRDDPLIVQAMIKGRSMVVRGTSQRGTATKDTFSLLGFTKAYREINRACGS